LACLRPPVGQCGASDPEGGVMHVRGWSFARVLVASGLGAVALVAAGLSGGGVANAANGNPVLLGQDNTATSTTSITSSGATGFEALGTQFGIQGGSVAGTGIYGVTQDSAHAGVYGQNTAAAASGGSGVVGVADANIGVS